MLVMFSMLTLLSSTPPLCTGETTRPVEGPVRVSGNAQCRIGDFQIKASAVQTQTDGEMITLNIDGPVTVRRGGQMLSADGAIAMVTRVGDLAVLKMLTLTFETDKPTPEPRR